MTAFVSTTIPSETGSPLADAHHTLTADGVTVAVFYGFAGLRLLDLLERTIARTDMTGAHTIMDGSSGKFTHGRSTPNSEGQAHEA